MIRRFLFHVSDTPRRFWTVVGAVSAVIATALFLMLRAVVPSMAPPGGQLAAPGGAASLAATAPAAIQQPDLQLDKLTQQGPGVAATTPAATPAPPNPAATASGGDDNTASNNDVAAATEAARAFFAAWLNVPAADNLTRVQTWLDNLRPTADPGLMQFLRETNLDAIPKTTIVTALPVRTGVTLATIRLNLSIGTAVEVTVAYNGTSWVAVPPSPDPVSG